MISGRRIYRRKLPHIQTDFRTYFITFITRDRWILPPVARDIVMEHIVFDHQRRMWLHVAVVMPEHVHMIAKPALDPSGWSYSLSAILRGIKGCSSRMVNRLLGRTSPLWQHESFDHELRHDESLREKSQYVCENPVRRGFVACVDDYPWIWREWIEGQRSAGS